MVTNYGKGGGGLQPYRWQVKFYPYGTKGGGGAEKVLAMLAIEVILTRQLEALARLMGGGGGIKCPIVINDQSLIMYH